MHLYNFSNPVEAHDAMCERLIWGDNSNPTDPDYDWTHGTEVALHDVGIHCKTIDFNYDLKKLWVPPSRWAMMVRQYIDPGALADCLDKIEERMGSGRRGGDTRGVSVLRTRMVQGKGIGRGVRRRWGSCMLSLSFRMLPTPTVTLHSRTTYFGYLALVDLAVAKAFATECAARVGLTDASSIALNWYLEQAQFHGFRSLAWMLGDKNIRTQMDEDVDNRQVFSPRRVVGNQVGYRKALDGYARILKSDRLGILYGDESFSSFARVRRRYHVEVLGEEYASQFIGGTRNRGGKNVFPVLPNLWAEGLDFGPLLNRAGESDWFESDDYDDDDHEE